MWLPVTITSQETTQETPDGSKARVRKEVGKQNSLCHPTLIHYLVREHFCLRDAVR